MLSLASGLRQGRDDSARDRPLAQSERQNHRSRRDANVLLSIRQVGHRTGLPGLAGVEMPQQFAIARVRGNEGSVTVSVEQQAAGRGHQTASQDSPAHIRYLPTNFS